LDPLEFIERIAAFIPHPRRHRHHYHGAFAPNSPLRKKWRLVQDVVLNKWRRLL
ncbi:MAG: transposase, partial [Parachlamydiaceae bacterium]|nr:transposase [Parachlamydiaceae bacterium]